MPQLSGEQLIVCQNDARPLDFGGFCYLNAEPGEPNVGRPELVAAYYDQLVAACPGCTVVAGDVLDSGSYASWLRRFVAASGGAPRLWGLHDYGDVTYGRTSGVDTVLGIVPGTLWIEETGGIVSLRDEQGRLDVAQL